MTGAASSLGLTDLKYSVEARFTSAVEPFSASCRFRAAVIVSPQNAYRSLPRDVASRVPISRRYGCIWSSGRSTPYRPDRMRTWRWANVSASVFSVRASKPVYTSPLNDMIAGRACP